MRARRAAYRQVIGLDPGKLAPAAPVDRFSPHTLPEAMAAGIAQNPAVATAQHNVDIAIHQVKVAEGALYPIAVAARQRAEELRAGAEHAAVVHGLGHAQYTAPIYQGGAEYAAIRQAKETPGPEAARPQPRPRPGPPWRGAGLGAARGRQELDRVDQEPGQGGGSRR